MKQNEIVFDKVVSCEEQKRVETLAVKGGGDPEIFSQKAGKNVAIAIDRYCKKHHLKRIVHGLIGKGNNGKDGLYALEYLAQMGYEVFKDLGQLEKRGIILDALYGIGFHKEIENQEAIQVQIANQSGLKIIALDIPSGVNGTTGESSNTHIIADHVIAIGTYKLGHLIGKGYQTYKTIELVDFGLDKIFFDQLKEVYRVIRLDTLKEPELGKKIHKYDRGYIGIIAGSKGLEGAAFLSASAALKAGAGMVRVFADEDFQLPLVEAVFSQQTMDAFLSHVSKLDVVLIGCGLDDTKKELINQILEYLIDHPKPLIVDAGAISVYMEMPRRPFAILTPNGSEMRQIKGKAQQGFILYEKGPPTWIYNPDDPTPYVIIEAEERLATAGTGDLLSGVMASYLARTKDYLYAAALASKKILEAAKSAKGPYPLATDILKQI
ncbi:MAG: bifunctional ADP-dependent NAD(P)H-hydrate dehydratase/NAD(P)H-hydrate epimerase [Chlamydiae bacterium]|nr:bifunctional ADP-dependent NAD(P)H-hydrate dehydratase/NAD(P)H-hydrate epimerase [Chlamydiota bacterium]